MAVNTAPQGVYYSGVASTPYPPRLPPPTGAHGTAETQHASLKRKKDAPTPPVSSLYSPIMEKSEVNWFITEHAFLRLPILSQF